MRDYKIPFWWVEKQPKSTSILEHVVVGVVSLAITLTLFWVVV